MDGWTSKSFRLEILLHEGSGANREGLLVLILVMVVVVAVVAIEETEVI